jgi:hypothetical protein
MIEEVKIAGHQAERAPLIALDEEQTLRFLRSRGTVPLVSGEGKAAKAHWKEGMPVLYVLDESNRGIYFGDIDEAKRPSMAVIWSPTAVYTHDEITGKSHKIFFIENTGGNSVDYFSITADGLATLVRRSNSVRTGTNAYLALSSKLFEVDPELFEQQK